MQRALYMAYVTGVAGSSVLVFYIGDGVIVGVDFGTGKYDGTFTEANDGGIKGLLNFTIAPGRPMITGGVAPAQAMPPIPIAFDFPKDFDKGPVVTLQTPLGPVNVRFEKVRDLP